MVRAMNTKVEERQGVKQAIVAVPEKTIGASFNDEPLSKFGFWADWEVKPKWNLCNSPGTDGGKVKSVGAFLEAMIAFWYAPMPRFALQWKSWGWRRLIIG